MTAPLAQPQLQAIVNELDEATARVRRYLAHSDERFSAPPRTNGWSAAECVRHLSLTTTAYLPLIDDALSKAGTRVIGAAHRYRRDVFGWLLAWFLEPPFRSKTKTTPPFLPIAVAGKDAAVAEFEQLQQALIRRVERCAGRDLEALRIVSPFNARVRYNLYSALTILTAHQRRHLWQADRALETAAAARP